MSQYSRIAKVPKMLLRNIYRSLLNDEAASSSATEAKIDERVAQAVISINDPDIILDLRKANGNPKSTTFDIFSEVLDWVSDIIVYRSCLLCTNLCNFFYYNCATIC